METSNLEEHNIVHENTVIDKKVKITSRKITKLFSHDDLCTIREAVRQCHIITSRTTLLMKIFCLEQIDINNEIPSLTTDFVEVCMKVVQKGECIKTRTERGKKELRNDDPIKLAKLEKQRDEKNASKLASLGLGSQVLKCYNRHFNKLVFDASLSLSYILEAEVTQIVTSLKNNVNARFQKYVGRYVLYYILQLLQITSAYRIGRKIRQLAGQVTNYILYGIAINKTSIDYMSSNSISVDYEALKKLLVPSNLKDVHLRQSKMLLISRLIETNFEDIITGKRLFQPIPLSTTFIPSFMRLSTVGMAQLLYDKQRIELFKLHYLDMYGVNLINLANKVSLCKSYKAISGNENASDYDEAMFSTRLWQFICNFKNKQYEGILNDKQRDGDWVFDNAIITNGTAVHFQITPNIGFRKSNFALARKTANAKIKTKVKKAIEAKLDPLVNLEFSDIRNPEDLKQLAADFDDTLFLSADPGKGCLADITDGLTHLKYTSGQRNKHTLQGVRIKEQNKKRKRFIVDVSEEILDEPKLKKNPSIEEIETIYLSKFSSKSCITSIFGNYLLRRNIIESEALKCYSKPLFRQNKFLAFSKTKSSEDIFLNAIMPLFKSKPHDDESLPFWMTSDAELINHIRLNHENRHKKKIVKLLYGNWGKTPNLKGSKPTPGIGLRRKIERLLSRTGKNNSSVTQHEEFTSKTCPCCRHRSLEKAELFENKTSLAETFCNEKHHLLRCTNVDCNSRWWNRDVAGSFNILYRGMGLILESKGILTPYIDCIKDSTEPKHSASRSERKSCSAPETLLAKKSRKSEPR